MIQRIQTLYLLLAAACVGAMLFLPLVQYTDGTAEFTLKASMLSDGADTSYMPAIYLCILLSLAALLPFVTIFLFKRRMVQIRLCVIELVLLLGGAVMTGIYCYLAYRVVSGLPFGAVSVKPWVGMPLLAMILVFLAVKAIFRDELLIRSLNRIR